MFGMSYGAAPAGYGSMFLYIRRGGVHHTGFFIDSGSSGRVFVDFDPTITGKDGIEIRPGAHEEFAHEAPPQFVCQLPIPLDQALDYLGAVPLKAYTNLNLRDPSNCRVHCWFTLRLLCQDRPELLQFIDFAARLNYPRGSGLEQFVPAFEKIRDNRIQSYLEATEKLIADYRANCPDARPWNHGRNAALLNDAYRSKPLALGPASTSASAAMRGSHSIIQGPPGYPPGYSGISYGGYPDRASPYQQPYSNGSQYIDDRQYDNGYPGAHGSSWRDNRHVQAAQALPGKIAGKVRGFLDRDRDRY